jgi:hypothetical protein
VHRLSLKAVFLFTLMLFALPAFSQVGVVISFAPPALPVYEQPLCPGEGYIWTPGYWAYDPGYGDYYWVPGTWVMVPQPGYYWTPPYWGWYNNGYAFHEGYWGPVVGFYGGINYGFGYFGNGYEGGRWQGNQFYYNRTVNNVNVTNIHNTYNTTINNVTVNHISYNGGDGGVRASPTAAEEAAARDRHLPPVAAQNQQIQAARSNPELRASANQGKPPIAATARPGNLTSEAVPAKEAGAPYHPPANRGAAPNANNRPPNEPARPATEAARPETEAAKPTMPTHAKDVPPHPVPQPPNTGNAKQDQKYAQQQQTLNQKQQQQHEQLAQKQEQDHQKAQQQANAARTQQMEQQHAQQTQQMEQKHAQQQQQLNQRQGMAAPRPQGPPPEAAHPPAEKH